MRAKEFLNEQNEKGYLSKRYRYGTRGLHKFKDVGGVDRVYELNRVMMAVACADGSSDKQDLDLDRESWIGMNNLAFPYSEAEQTMMKAAYNAVGSDWEDLNGGDLGSGELPSINKESPVKPFKGYKR